ncbi:transmembrane protein 138 [Thrips palmi]|uniref:Transmembrane protein 138 n=1 Tax=Thrips palmi TaxID=161013 RepID=A0A6P8YYG8_THRPL|nr:transmembrane protein 138 [Thrips palmi]
MQSTNSNTRYSILIIIQFTLLLTDLLMNSFSEFLRYDSHLLLIFYVIQDLCLIFAFTTLLLSFFSTYLFQAGLVYLIYNKFCAVIYVMLLYLALTIMYHIWSLNMRWSKPLDYTWTDGLHTLHVAQRFVAVLYYHLYKRAVLRISDPRFYKDADWTMSSIAIS